MNQLPRPRPFLHRTMPKYCDGLGRHPSFRTPFPPVSAGRFCFCLLPSYVLEGEVLHQLPHNNRLQIGQLLTQVLNLCPETGREGKRILGSEMSSLCLQSAELKIVSQVFYHLCQSNFRGARERRGITLGRGFLGGVRGDAQDGHGQDSHRQGLGPITRRS
jgi:hypothetical protein